MIEDFLNNNLNNKSDDSDSISQAKIKEEDLAAEEKKSEIKKALDEFVKRSLLEQQAYEKIKQEAHIQFASLLSQVKLHAKDNESHINKDIWEAIYSLIEPILSILKINISPEFLLLLKKKKEQSWLFSIIKLMLAKLFKPDLGWEERLHKEIAELQKKLEDGTLSPEELKRLEALQTLKLKLQLSVASMVLGVISMLLGFDLGITRSQEIVQKSYEKIEALSKEPEVKQVNESIEIKRSENEPQCVKDIEKVLKNYQESDKSTKKMLLSDPVSLAKQIDLFRPIAETYKELSHATTKPETQEKPKQAAPAVPEQKPQPKAEEKKGAKKEQCFSKSLFSDRKDNVQGNVNKGKVSIELTNKEKVDDFFSGASTKFTEKPSSHGAKNIRQEVSSYNNATQWQERVSSEFTGVKIESSNCGRGR